MRKLTIAIDGYGATGKGTTAKQLAKILGYMYLDTGAMYRAVTLYAQRHNLLDVDEVTKSAMMQDIQIDFMYNISKDRYDILLNGENVEDEIRQTTLAMQLPKIVTVQGIRDVLIQMQKSYGAKGAIVADGRDMGTVVFPDADYKFFLTCDDDTRVERRYKQLESNGQSADKQKIREEMNLRDMTDYLGPDAVNRKADDAIVVDTTHCTITEQIQAILSIIYAKEGVSVGDNQSVSQ